MYISFSPYSRKIYTDPCYNAQIMKDILVQKFGGTSVASIERIQAVADICIKAQETENTGLVVVVSAMGDSTDDLLGLLGQLTDTPPPREKDMLLSSGELVSMSLLATAIQTKGHKALSLTGWQAGVQTEDSFNNARIYNIDTARIQEALQQGYIVIVAGFQGLDSRGEITTLGRGGSDTSAVALAAALEAKRCDIYTDVCSVQTTDPRIVPQTGKLKYITYDEMLELAVLGAKVLHPRSVETAKNFKIPMRVRSSWEADNVGTLIVESYEQIKEEHNMLERQKAVRGVALDADHSRLSIFGVPDQPGVAHQIFCELAAKGISVDLIAQCVSQDGLSEVDFTVRSNDTDKAEAVLQAISQRLGAQKVTVDSRIAKVSIVGAGMIDEPGIAAKMFQTLGEHGINIQIITTGEIHISCVIDAEQGQQAVALIHDAFALHEQ